MRTTITILALLASAPTLPACAHTPTVVQAVDAAQVATLGIGTAAHAVQPKDEEQASTLEQTHAIVSEIEALLADLDKLAPALDAIIAERKAQGEAGQP
jgi:hypothetical protein